jgi:hypothetical protein
MQEEYSLNANTRIKTLTQEQKQYPYRAMTFGQGHHNNTKRKVIE